MYEDMISHGKLHFGVIHILIYPPEITTLRGDTDGRVR